MPHIPPPLPRRFFVGTLCLISVIISDVLFYAQPIGWTLGLYTLLLCAALIWHDKAECLKTHPGRVFTLGIIGLVFAHIYQPDALTIILTLIALVTLGITSRAGWCNSIWVWAGRWIRFVFAG